VVSGRSVPTVKVRVPCTTHIKEALEAQSIEVGTWKVAEAPLNVLEDMILIVGAVVAFVEMVGVALCPDVWKGAEVKVISPGPMSPRGDGFTITAASDAKE
jgi:hypothetical protein